MVNSELNDALAHVALVCKCGMSRANLVVDTIGIANAKALTTNMFDTIPGGESFILETDSRKRKRVKKQAPAKSVLEDVDDIKLLKVLKTKFGKEKAVHLSNLNTLEKEITRKQEQAINIKLQIDEIDKLFKF